jgi:hypothetical protein
MLMINTSRRVASVAKLLVNVVKQISVLMLLLMLCVFFAVMLVAMFASKITAVILATWIKRLSATVIAIMNWKRGSNHGSM